MKKIPFALIGTGNFSLQRLKILGESNQFDPVAIIDIDIEKVRWRATDGATWALPK